MKPTRRRLLLLSLLCAALACLPFLPGLPGGFLFDDIPNIVENTGVQLESLQPRDLVESALGAQRGGYTRVLPMLTFALDYYRGNGYEPANFRATNIAIHALTAVVMTGFLATLLLLSGVARARWGALTMALAWALHPLQVSSVLYVVQRMQTMATLFLVLALWSYVGARQAQMEGRSGRTGWLLASLLWMLAIACKEDAVLLPVYGLALELTLLRFRADGPEDSRKLKLGYLTAAAAGALAFLFLAAPHYWSWSAYPGRDFSTIERLLTQGRVLCMYLWQILVPLPSHMPFYYDWLQPSRGLLEPWTTVPSWLLLAALLGIAWRLRHRRPLFAFGLFLFFAGHFVTSNVIGLELAFEHRNHFPLIGIILAVGDLLAAAASRYRVTAPIAVSACVLALVALGVGTASRAHAWRSNLSLAQKSTELAPLSPRAWNSLCISWFDLGGGARVDNPYLNNAIAACEKEADVAKDSIVGMTNIIAFKTLQGSIIPSDWTRYMNQLRQVPMTNENASAIWIILNRVRDGMAVDGDRVLEAIDIINNRRPYGTIESAAIGYFILGHTKQPDQAYPYFERAAVNAKDPSFSKGLADELRKEGRPDWANQLESLALQGGQSMAP